MELWQLQPAPSKGKVFYGRAMESLHRIIYRLLQDCREKQKFRATNVVFHWKVRDTTFYRPLE